MAALELKVDRNLEQKYITKTLFFLKRSFFSAVTALRYTVFSGYITCPFLLTKEYVYDIFVRYVIKKRRECRETIG